MFRVRCLVWLTALVTGLLAGGCRANPVNLAMMMVGDAVSDAEVQKLQKELMGRTAADADQRLGIRRDTLRDTRDRQRELLIYLVENDRSGGTRYVVEVQDGEIVAVSKTVQNIDGMEDAIRESRLKPAVMRKPPEFCEREAGLGEPLAILRSRQTGDEVRVYDVRQHSNLRGARYCVLRFDRRRQCHHVRLVGVSASTKKDPAGG